VRAVWSFWSKPFLAATSSPWREPIHHWLAWGLSLRLARSHYPRTALVTDTAGKALLVDALGLRYGEVSTVLDQLADVDPALWMLGKLVAYGMQHEPFVHVDADVFLWRPLPAEVAGAPVFAQHPEHIDVGRPGGPQAFEEGFARAGLALPPEWEWYRSHQPRRRYREANCGIVGGTNTSLIRHYARLALGLVRDPEYAAFWSSTPLDGAMNMTLEQFLVAACVDYHRFDPGSAHRGSYLRYLFPSGAQAWDPERARRAGYTHLLSVAKEHPLTTARLADRIRSKDPEFYARCEAVSSGLSKHPRS
jgi:hypothetical protein